MQERPIFYPVTQQQICLSFPSVRVDRPLLYAHTRRATSCAVLRAAVRVAGAVTAGLRRATPGLARRATALAGARDATPGLPSTRGPTPQDAPRPVSPVTDAAPRRAAPRRATPSHSPTISATARPGPAAGCRGLRVTGSTFYCSDSRLLASGRAGSSNALKCTKKTTRPGVAWRLESLVTTGLAGRGGWSVAERGRPRGALPL